MGLPVRDQLKWWGLAAAVFLAALYLLGDVLMPFIVGGAIAYFLDPIADRLERAGMSRTGATTLISLVMLFVAVLLILAVIPTLASQLAALIDAAPRILGQVRTFTETTFPQLMDETSTIHKTLISIGETIKSRGGELANTLLGSAMNIISAIIFMVVVPVVSFYLLLDWDHMVSKINSMLPLDHAPVIRRLASEINQVLAAFVRGQLSVCLVMGLYYAITLAFAGLQFGLVVGAIAGAITFIPYVGALVGGALAIGLALFQFWGEWVSIGIVIGIFALGQFLEGNVITPRLVGNSVGLHPVWLLFALSAFGSIFGFVGMLVAVPVAAAIGVLARFGITQYQASLLFTGLTGQRKPKISEDEA